MAHEAIRQNAGRRSQPLQGLSVNDRRTDPRLPALAGSRGFRTLLRNPLFLRLWIAQLISQIIMNASNYGLIVLVASASHSVTATGGAIVAFALPAALFGAPAGVLVDRLDRRMVLWVSNVLRGLAALGFVISLFIDHNAIVPVLLLSFFTAIVGQFFAPAEGAAIPQLVHRDELMNALALFNITFTLAQAIGLIMLGPVILLFLPTYHVGAAQGGFDLLPVESLFLIVAVFYGVASLLILSIPRAKLRAQPRPGMPAHPADSTTVRGIWLGIGESWRFMRRDKKLWHAVFQLVLAGVTTAVVSTIAPTFVETFFHQNSNRAALVFVPAGVGLVVSSVLIPDISRRVSYGRTVSFGVVLLSGCIALLTLSRALAEILHPHRWWAQWPYLSAAILLTFLIGMALNLINVPAQTRMQEHSPSWLKGRVIALQTMLLNAATVPVVLLFGQLADRFTLSLAMDTLAVGLVFFGLLSVYRGTRDTRRAGRLQGA